jgi:anaerobic nitric oxide reductase transcription regulator
VDVRLIAATNRDLAEEVRNGRYRADFYHRLSVYPLLVPALRDRGRDVLLLSGFFLEQNRSRMGLNSLRLNSDAQAALLAYNWPGNVRELEHLIGRSALKALGNCKDRPKILSLSAADLDLPTGSVEVLTEQPVVSPVSLVAGDLREATENYQRQLISACLERHHNNWASAARELGLDRANLGRMAKRLGMKYPPHCGEGACTRSAAKQPQNLKMRIV